MKNKGSKLGNLAQRYILGVNFCFWYSCSKHNKLFLDSHQDFYSKNPTCFPAGKEQEIWHPSEEEE